MRLFKNKQAVYIVLLIAATVLLVLFEILKPRPIDWSRSFSKYHKKPFGGFLVYACLPDLFPGRRITPVHDPVYNAAGPESLQNTNYLFINEAFRLNDLDARRLLELVGRGNQAFIAAEHFAGLVADTLNLEVGLDLVDSDSVFFVNPALQPKQHYIFEKQMALAYFTRFDTSRTAVLSMDTEQRVNYIRVPFGAGTFYLSTLPLVFTNYTIAQGRNADYLFQALSFLPVCDVLWDEYYKVGRLAATTPLRFVLRHPSLKWAYITALASVLLFIVFAGRRRQRVIPIQQPPRNTSLEFVETVGRLYYEHGDHKNLAEKRITYFLEDLRSRFHVQAARTEDELREIVAKKSGMPRKEVEALFAEINEVQARSRIDGRALLRLNTAIENFDEKAFGV